MEKLKIATASQNHYQVLVQKYDEAESCVCGHCNREIGLDVYLKFFKQSSMQQGKQTPIIDFVVGQCPICGKPNIFNVIDKTSLPSMREFENVLHLPSSIESLYNEMRDAFAAKSYTCCVIAGRTLIAHIAVEQGAKDDANFAFYVDYLVNNYLSKNSSKPWVDKVRQLGNRAAHDLVIATKNDAESSLKFLTAILKIIYEFPNSI